jgi:hypothetical protein
MMCSRVADGCGTAAEVVRAVGDVDLDELDARLAELGVDLDDTDTDAGFGVEAVTLVDDRDWGAPDRWADPGAAADPVAEPDDDLWLADLVEDLRLSMPAPAAPPGYHLDPRAVLRYDHDGSAVPGQLRVTLQRRWRFCRDGGVVLVPAIHAANVAELAWVPDVVAASTSTKLGAARVAAHPVPSHIWDAMASTVVGVTAPELAVDALIGLAELARIAGLTHDSVRTYLARGAVPAPTARVGSTPLWSLPVVLVWASNRRPPGRPRRR